MTTSVPPPPPRRGPGVYIAIVLTAAIALPLGGYFERRALSPSAASSPATTPAPAAPKPLFVCPMHPAVTQDHPGTCPICGMKLVEQKPAPTPATTPEQYVCPMHPAVVSDHPANCPICGMKLVKPAGHEKKLLFYRSPMDPRQTSPVPMKDSMGMDYLPVYEGGAEHPSEVDGLALVTLDPAQVQLIGLRTAMVDTGPVGRSLRTVGRVAFDETRVRRVNVKTPGYVEHVYLDFVGKPVRRGQPLFDFYSPEVLAAENELLVALKTKDAPGLLAAAKRRLELLDVPASELERLEREGVPSRTITIASPASGVVTKKDLVEGARLEAGAMPYEVVDLSTVWVLADVYESELRFVSAGMPASLRLGAYPDRTWPGKVLFMDPVMDPKTRTVRVRLAFPNPAGDLRPELFGEVTLDRPARDALRVPTDALIPNGNGQVVFVARGEGKFEPRRVEVGEAGRDFTEVLGGLAEGDAVVTRANFLIDSESSLKASLARLADAAPPPDGGSAR